MADGGNDDGIRDGLGLVNIASDVNERTIRYRRGRHLRMILATVAVAGTALPFSAAVPASALTLHVDAVSGVTLLSPVGTGAATAPFDPAVDLRIEVFALSPAGDSAVGPPVGPSFATTATGDRQIKVQPGSGNAGQYHAKWRTSDSRRPNGSMVRVELRLPVAQQGAACNTGVSVAAGCLAFFDVLLRKNDKGTVPPGILALTNGQTLPIKVHVARGALVVDSGLRQLEGAPGSAAAEAILDVPFDFHREDYAPHPDLGGLMVTYRALYIVFTLDTTVAQANVLLAEIGAEIIGGVPGRAGQIEGILAVRVPTRSHSEMDALVAGLRRDPRVLVAVQESLFEASETPKWSDAPDWSWDVDAQGGNWGLEHIRMPQLWNLNRWVFKDGGKSSIGVLDTGFHAHPDLTYTALTPTAGATARGTDHGTHVAGTIAATYDNGGVDGVNPYADLAVYLTTGSAAGAGGLFDFLEKLPDLDVINLSLGYAWSERSPPLDPETLPATRDLVRSQALIFRIWQGQLRLQDRHLPFIVSAAGNDSDEPLLGFVDVDAKWSSPWNYAALVQEPPSPSTCSRPYCPPADNVLVVGALAPRGFPVSTFGVTWAPFSNSNPHVLAPGFAILSTGSPAAPYMYKSGTSMAAPHVTGLAGYLLTLDPTLTATELHALLRHGGGPGSQLGVDAFTSALEIDALRGNTTILTRLLDIDDGTDDGNERLVCAGRTCSETTTEDFDADGGQGDGVVDMSDFRRWRDWFLFANSFPELALDGDAEHPKKDINHDGFHGPGLFENIYPDGDFNGDGVLDLDPNSRRFVPGHVNAPATDLEVLQTLFDDADYTATELPDLIQSADIHVDPAACMEAGVIGIQTKIFDATTGIWVDDRFDVAEPMSHVYTLPITPAGYTVRVEAFDDAGRVVGISQNSFAARLGSDSWFAPTCGGISLSPSRFDLVLNAGDTVTRTFIVESDGLTVDWQIANSVEHVEPSSTGGSIAAGGQASVDLTVTCPDRAGGYGGLLDLQFHDRGGQPFSAGVPEAVTVDLVCLEGGVVAEPETLTMSARPGETVSRTFRLDNKGTALLYAASPGPLLVIENEEEAEGALPAHGARFITVTATCPAETGEYPTAVALSFEREDGKPVDVDVPASVPVNLSCEYVAPFRLVDQRHSNQVSLHFPYQQVSLTWRSNDSAGTGSFESQEQGGAVNSTPTEGIGFGQVSSNINLSDSHDFSLDPLIGGVRTRTATSSMSFEATVTGPVPRVEFAGDLSQTYTQSILAPLLVSGDLQHAITVVTFELLEPAELVANWSCDVECDIELRPVSAFCGWVFRGWLEESFTGTLPPGRYMFAATRRLVAWQDEFSTEQHLGYSLEFTFPGGPLPSEHTP